MDFTLDKWRCFDSSIQSLLYPFPLKIIRLCFLIIFTITSLTAWLKFSACSNSSAIRHNVSATMVLITVLGSAMEALDGTIRNSNLFPVKANGDVRFRSVVSCLNRGRVDTPTFIYVLLWEMLSSPFSICSKISVRSSPKKTLMIAGGASSPPSR